MRPITYSALAAYWAGAILWGRKLPDRYPIHFNFRGEPDRWISGSAEWFLLPAIATATVLLLVGVEKLSRRAPQLWNIPEKKRFLALTSEQREPIVNELSGIMNVVGLYVVLLFVVCQVMIYQSALSGRLQLSYVLHVVLWGGLIWLIVYSIRMNKRVKRLILDADSATAGRTS
jgi:uncharacterized membrane protein